MRKVIFKIDDKEYFRRDLKRQNCTGKQAEDILNGIGDFKAIYTLHGTGNTVDRYTLTDYDGNKMNINDLNGYEKGVVLNDCYAYFTGNEDKPYGVVEILEEEV